MNAAKRYLDEFSPQRRFHRFERKRTHLVSSVFSVAKQPGGLWQLMLGARVQVFAIEESSHFEAWLRFLLAAQRTKQPVFVEWNEQRLVERVLPVLRTQIRSVGDPMPDGRVPVFFRASPAPYHLRASNPEYRIIRQRLEEVQANDPYVLVTVDPNHEIVSVD